MPEQPILMARARAPALQFDTLAGLHKDRIARLFVALEEARDRRAERTRERLQRCQGRRDDAVLNLGEHADREAGVAREVRDGDPEFLPASPYFVTNRLFQIIFLRFADGVRILRQSAPLFLGSPPSERRRP
jgi:hypothetical protein